LAMVRFDAVLFSGTSARNDAEKRVVLLRVSRQRLPWVAGNGGRQYCSRCAHIGKCEEEPGMRVLCAVCSETRSQREGWHEAVDMAEACNPGYPASRAQPMSGSAFAFTRVLTRRRARAAELALVGAC